MLNKVKYFIFICLLSLLTATIIVNYILPLSCKYAKIEYVEGCDLLGYCGVIVNGKFEIGLNSKQDEYGLYNCRIGV